jgi:hypothetical protein
MSAPAFEKVITLLPKLDADELMRVKGLIQALNPAAAPSAAQTELSFIYDALCNSLWEDHRGSATPFKRFMASSPQRQTFEDRVPYVRKLVNDISPGAMRSERGFIYGFIGKCIVNDLKSRNKQYGMRNVINNLHRAGEIIDNQYPEYLSTGGIKFLIHTMTKGEFT